jgi:uncharacterized protein YjbI with pentapeptide repeats
MGWRDWTGVGERRWKTAPNEQVQPSKTLWDWLQLLIVPAILIAITFAWSATQSRSDNKREDRRIAADRATAEEARQDATLQAYLDEMSGLMLDKKLLASKEGDGVRAVARTVTLTALRRLDGERRGAVVRFLSEAQLVLGLGRAPMVFLDGADLRDARLRAVDLREAGLRHADLARAYLAGANLWHANLPFANFARANLARAYLAGANLEGANLERANLERADLGGAYVVGADFGGANLAGANFADALFAGGVTNLARANLEGARNLNLYAFITELRPDLKKNFLDSQKAFLDSLSREELAKFNLSPEKLARFRRRS